MSGILHALARHGYLSLAVLVFLESIGMPVPAALALAAAGAAAATGLLNPLTAIAVALAAILCGDTILFFVGRKTGWMLLGILCRLSANPESCILASAESFYKRGRTTLVVAKFIPGINTMAPPLAGSMKMRLRQFLWLDAAGALLYVLAYGVAGYVFSDFIAMLTRGAETASHMLAWLVAVAIVAYAIYHAVLYWKHRVYRVVPRVQADEVVRRMKEDEAAIIIADVRSHGYYDAGSERIRGSLRLEPNKLPQALQDLPRDKEIYLYCT